MRFENTSTVAARGDAVLKLENAKNELQALERIAETEVRSVAKAFEGLADYTDVIVELAAGIVGCVESENVSSVLPKVQTLGAAVNRFIGDRLRATPGILEMVTREVELLNRLSLITQAQRAIALKTGALRVLTNIEVARLGEGSADFHYLAQELADFSESVFQDTKALDIHTRDRRAEIEKTKRVLSVELPELQEKLAGIEVELGKALAEVESSLTQLSKTPAQFRTGVQDIAQQVAGVVTAIQSDDITRQQIEHVTEAFTLVSARLADVERTPHTAARELSQAYVALTIQAYQLRSIKETIAGWTSQIRTCMDGIMRVSASEVVGIGPMVLDQERKVASHLTHIELLERDSQAYSERMQRSFSGLSNLMQLFRDHLQKSKSVSDRFQILSLNSIIKSSYLGQRGGAMLAIAKIIGETSEQWGEVTRQSSQAMQEILKLLDQSKGFVEAFSDARNQKLREAQTETRGGLETLRTAAVFAVEQSGEMKIATERMQANLGGVGKTGDLLDSCSGNLDAILAQVEGVRHQLKVEYPELDQPCDTSEVEKLFSASYTTEMERDVMRAALGGGPLPVVQQTFGGNAVELF
jgi:hypothetical protein